MSGPAFATMRLPWQSSLEAIVPSDETRYRNPAAGSNRATPGDSCSAVGGERIAVGVALVAGDETRFREVVAQDRASEGAAVEAGRQNARREVERIDHEDEMMRLGTRLGARPGIGFAMPGIPSDKLAGVIGGIAR